MNKISASSEDYLKAIVAIGGTPQQPVRSIEIARRMHVSKTAVHNAIAQLKKAGLVEHAHYKQVLLTEKGFAFGQELHKRHSYLVAFLTKELGVADDIAEHDACQMEHAISDECFERWMAYIDERGLVETGFPDFDAIPRIHAEEAVGIGLD